MSGKTRGQTKKGIPFFLLAALILIFAIVAIVGIKFGSTTVIKGINDIRWGIDIRGGVEGVFEPDAENPTREEMDSASLILKTRLINEGITDHELYTDYSTNRIIVRFPWKADTEEFDPVEAIEELGEMAHLTFKKGYQNPDGEILFEGKYVEKASYTIDTSGQYNPPYLVLLQLTNEGASKFAEATEKTIGDYLSIYMDDTFISGPGVSQKIDAGEAVISGISSAEEARDLAEKIQAGALPFKLSIESYQTIHPTLGQGALSVMAIAASIALALISILVILIYKMNGVVTSIALIGQVAGSIAAISGFFPFLQSFTLTIPGIAGMILSIGMGVDANVIISERIKEELGNGKTLSGAVSSGYKLGFNAVFDGNITVIIVAIILMGAFGPPGSIFSTVLSPIFSLFGLIFNLFGVNIGAVTTGNIYSFGYTLLVGIIFNFIMGVLLSNLMRQGAIKIKAFRKPWLFGGEKE